MKKIVLALIAICTVSACASVYRQPGMKSLESADIAVIEDDPCPGIQCLIIIEIDGKRRGVGWFHRYEFQPGLRTIEFAFSGLNFTPTSTNIASTSNVLVEFEARPGATYTMRANADPNSLKWRPEIIEKASGVVVSRVSSTAK